MFRADCFRGSCGWLRPAAPCAGGQPRRPSPRLTRSASGNSRRAGEPARLPGARGRMSAPAARRPRLESVAADRSRRHDDRPGACPSLRARRPAPPIRRSPSAAGPPGTEPRSPRRSPPRYSPARCRATAWPRPPRPRRNCSRPRRPRRSPTSRTPSCSTSSRECPSPRSTRGRKRHPVSLTPATASLADGRGPPLRAPGRRTRTTSMRAPAVHPQRRPRAVAGLCAVLATARTSAFHATGHCGVRARMRQGAAAFAEDQASSGARFGRQIRSGRGRGGTAEPVSSRRLHDRPLDRRNAPVVLAGRGERVRRARERRHWAL
jgi:hypothetical protein